MTCVAQSIIVRPLQDYNVHNSQATVFTNDELASAARRASQLNKVFVQSDGDSGCGANTPTANSATLTSIDAKLSLKAVHRQLRSIVKSSTGVDVGYIDVWWMYDDGGLSMLVPHLLRLDGSYLDGAVLHAG